jgi:hypothetical protein
MKSKKNKFFFFSFLGPSPKRTLISRQNLIKTKSPVIIFEKKRKFNTCSQVETYRPIQAGKVQENDVRIR